MFYYNYYKNYMFTRFTGFTCLQVLQEVQFKNIPCFIKTTKNITGFTRITKITGFIRVTGFTRITKITVFTRVTVWKYSMFYYNYYKNYIFTGFTGF